MTRGPRRYERGSAAVALAAQHELVRQRGARRRRGVGDDRHRLGDAARDRHALAVRPRSPPRRPSGRACPRGPAAGRCPSGSGAGPRPRSRSGARAPWRPPRRRPAARPCSRAPSKIGWPCGQVLASPIACSMRSSTTGDIQCSSRSASSWTWSQGMSKTSVRKRSISRWRRTIWAACSLPVSVNVERLVGVAASRSRRSRGGRSSRARSAPTPAWRARCWLR